MEALCFSKVQEAIEFMEKIKESKGMVLFSS